MTTSLRTAALVVLLPVIAPPLARTLVAQEPRPVGNWRLDQTHVDTSATRMGPPGGEGRWRGQPPTDTGGVEGGPTGEPRTGQYGGGEHHHGYGYGGMDDKLRARMHNVMQLVRHAPQRIDISEDARSVTVTDDSGMVKTWPIDGKKLKDTLADGSEMESILKWQKNDLVYERRLGSGIKLTETYRLGLGGNRLIAFINIEGLMEPRSFTRQYAPAEEAAAAQ
jgi:hypothetical protein